MSAGFSLAIVIAATPGGAQQIRGDGQAGQSSRAAPAAAMPPAPQQRSPHVNGGSMAPAPGYRPIQVRGNRPRWGGMVGGRWHGGSNAPGGWNAYRRPIRGWTLPRYWIAPSFFIEDYAYYGLATPPRGYHWSRYYDDAVLVDSHGRVWDAAGGVDWDYDDGYRDGQGTPMADDGAPIGDGGYGAGYAPPPMVNQPAYQTSPLPQGGYATTVTSGGYISGGYWYPPVVTTTITVQSAPVVTTSYVTETTSAPARHVYHAKARPARKWRTKAHPGKAHPACSCACSCR